LPNVGPCYTWDVTWRASDFGSEDSMRGGCMHSGLAVACKLKHVGHNVGPIQ
jgi:hypothetical protein